jgi:hypothetical protein
MLTYGLAMPIEQPRRPNSPDPKIQLTIGARSETREPANGAVSVYLGNGKPEIHGEMVDVSPSGFRIRYRGKALTLGSEVRISYPWGKVHASIVWVSEIGEYVETGFLITG